MNSEKRFEYLQSQIDKLTANMCDMQDALIKKGTVVSFRTSDRRVLDMLYDFLDNGYHPMLHDLDLTLLFNVVMVMSAVYPEEEFFRGVPTNISKRLGVLLAKDAKLSRLKCSYHIRADKKLGTKHSNVYKDLWVLRDVKKYKHFGPADLYREYTKQRHNAAEIYNLKVQEQESAVEDPPSFM